jgi:hypothetical protein
MEDMQNFFSGGAALPPLPGMPAAGGAAPAGMGMAGMPELTPDLMTSMMGAMYAQGLDPTTMQPDDFMRYAQQYMQTMGQGGQQGFGGQTPQMGGQPNQQQAGGYGGGGFEQRGGRNRGGRRW